jgi:hypothetical protein
MAFHAIKSLFVSRSDFNQIANEVGVAAQDSVVFLYRLSQTLHVRREQLQTFSQSPLLCRQTLHVRSEQLQTFS